MVDRGDPGTAPERLEEGELVEIGSCPVGVLPGEPVQCEDEETVEAAGHKDVAEHGDAAQLAGEQQAEVAQGTVGV